jgi:hypothetical protein
MSQWLLAEGGKGLLGIAGRRVFGGTAKLLVAALAVLLLAALATCVPGRSGKDGSLVYSGPIETGIERGSFLAGTPIQYLGKTEEGAMVSIEGQQALKKVGDSLNWVHNPVEGVAVDLNSRVLLITKDKLHVLGSAKVTIVEPDPRATTIHESAPIRYKLPVDYHIKKGQLIPGTTILYMGETEQGAQLGNVEGYPYREAGDSIVWKGQLHDRVWLALNLRTVLISESRLNVAGIAELFIAP